MKAIMLMFDSLNKNMLPCYGGKELIAPNFSRLAERTVRFENFYMGSMPCMPARREIHTGRYNFLHREWGPLEPFDDSMPEILKKNGIYSHLITDHFHYFEDGGCGYVNRYSSWEFERGQEGDHWVGQVKDPQIPLTLRKRDESPLWRQDFVNREHMIEHPLKRTFERGLEFIERNLESDNWFLQIENFSPHEPFYSSEEMKSLYGDFSNLTHFNWPPYASVKESDEDVAHLRGEYMALVTMCDSFLGKLLDVFDKYDLWKDTMLIVNADHGILLGEHGRYGKKTCSNYDEIAHIPFFIYDPRFKIQNERREALSQTIDIPPTILEFFGLKIPKDMEGVPLSKVVKNDTKIRDFALFGLFGGEVNITDGRWVYMKAPTPSNEKNLFNYTLMPSYMASRFSEKDLENFQLVNGFSFTKGSKVLKFNPKPPKKRDFLEYEEMKDRLYDLKVDKHQENPVRDEGKEKFLISQMKRLMKENDAPKEQFERLGIQ